MNNTEKMLAEFDNKFPNKLAEVIDDFSSPVKSELRNFFRINPKSRTRNDNKNRKI